MYKKRRADNQTWQRESIADLLHRRARRTKSRRCNVRSTVIVHDTSDGDIDGSHDTLTNNQCFRILTRVAHLGDDVEKGWCASICENNRGYGGKGFGRLWVGEQLIVRFPWASSNGCVGRLILYPDSDCQDQYCEMVSLNTPNL